MLKVKLDAIVTHEYATSRRRPLARRDPQRRRPRRRAQRARVRSRRRNPELANEVRALMFVFEDILKLDDRSIQLVLKDVDTKDLALALRGSSEDVNERIMANMSSRGAEMLREEMEFMQPQRRRVIEEAQTKIVAAVRKLEDAGEIVISRGGDDEIVRLSAWRRFAFPALEGVPVTIKGSSPAERAAEIVAHARATAESVAAAAEAAGREAGYAAGLEEGRARVADAEAALAAVARELDAAARAHREHIERQAAELAVALAEKIVGTALDVRPELVVDVVAHRAPRPAGSRPRRRRGQPRRPRRSSRARSPASPSARGPRARRRRARAARRPRRLHRPHRRGRDRRHAPPRSSRARPRSSATRSRRPHDGRRARPRAPSRSLRSDLRVRRGLVANLIGLVIEATGLRASIGEVCVVSCGRNREPITAEVVGFRDGRTLLMPLGELRGDRPRRTRSSATGQPLRASGRRRAARAACSTASAARSTAASRSTRRRAALDRRARRPRRSARTPIEPAARPRRARARRARPLRPRPAPRHLRRLRRRQVDAARHDRPQHRRRRQRDRPRRRARPRGARVRRARPRPTALERSVVVVATSDEPALVRIKAAFGRRRRSPSTSATRATTCC